MEIGLGRKGDYSVRAMIVLARMYPGGRRKSRQIAATMDIPERYLPQIMAPLVRAGLVQATAGPDGGYELARPPGEVTLHEIIETAEGPIAVDRCLLEGGPCDWEHICPVHDDWVRARSALERELHRTTLARLAAEDERIERGDYEVPATPLHDQATARRGERAAMYEGLPSADASASADGAEG